jgi:polyhydroxybutyrate depolymerase
VDAIIEDMSKKYNVDPKRVYLVGHSNGGFMSHRTACDLSPRIAAIVSLAGAVWKDASKCKPTSPVSILEVHGNADTTISYDGGSAAAGLPAFPSAKETVADWAALEGCSATLTDMGKTLDLDTGLPGEETKLEHHDGCKQGAVELWTIQGGGHIPSLTSQWGSAIYGFLESHPKP